MAFIETPRFPDAIALNAKRVRKVNVDIKELASGVEVFNILWSQKKRSFDIGIAIRTEADYNEVNQWVEALDGPADGFRFKDWGDFAADYTTGLLVPLVSGLQSGTAGFGYGVPTYQLVKQYSRGSKSKTRDIKKPISSGFQVQANSGNISSSLDTTTGIVTLTATQSKSINSHTVGATHKFTMASAFSPNFSNGQLIYVTGVTGTAATKLNSLPLTVTAVSGADVSVNVDTTGLTASGGTAYMHYQSSDTLKWSGQFDIPVRFQNTEVEDLAVMRYASGTVQQAPSILLVEIRIP